jgi:hydroxymethylpyrimidine pyrophosphatase-like HAD family hydrolase
VNIFFDVDETILGYDGSLRPLVAEVFGRLVDQGHRIFVWSGVRTGDVVQKLVVDLCVDDYPDIVDAFGGMLVIPYRYARPDQELERVYAAIQAAHSLRQTAG